ncbi:MAG: hypothetical protein M3072_13880 [Candidatus Dormibacteraeota bacterium]|nr:hypothetical protein [Candidatus Dormibacteraeota bacterium]
MRPRTYANLLYLLLSFPLALAYAMMLGSSAALGVPRWPAASGGVTVAHAEPLPALLVLADRDRLTQVLINLVRNGVNHTPEGGAVYLQAGELVQRVVNNLRFRWEGRMMSSWPIVPLPLSDSTTINGLR